VKLYTAPEVLVALDVTCDPDKVFNVFAALVAQHGLQVARWNEGEALYEIEAVQAALVKFARRHKLKRGVNLAKGLPPRKPLGLMGISLLETFYDDARMQEIIQRRGEPGN
jgi:hypothetical protein